MKLSPALLVAPALLVGGCGGSSSNYAGMSAQEAAEQALGAVADESKKPGNPFKERVRLLKMVRADNGEGRDAWVAVFEVPTTLDKKLCIPIWVDRHLTVTTYNYGVEDCPADVVQAKGEMEVNG